MALRRDTHTQTMQQRVLAAAPEPKNPSKYTGTCHKGGIRRICRFPLFISAAYAHPASSFQRYAPHHYLVENDYSSGSKIYIYIYTTLRPFATTSFAHPNLHYKFLPSVPAIRGEHEGSTDRIWKGKDIEPLSTNGDDNEGNTRGGSGRRWTGMKDCKKNCITFFAIRMCERALLSFAVLSLLRMIVLRVPASCSVPRRCVRVPRSAVSCRFLVFLASSGEAPRTVAFYQFRCPFLQS